MTLTFRLTIVVAALGAGCGSDAPPSKQHQPRARDAGLPWSQDLGFSWTDIGGQYYQDGWTSYQDQGSLPDPDQGVPPADGGTPDAGNNNCKPAVGASCPQPCNTGEVCADIKGGTCVKVVELSGPASNKAAIKEVALAYIDCWQKQPSSDTLCVAFDTCKMTGTITGAMVEDWVCNMAQVSDFPSAGKHDKAQELCGCSWYGYDRADWQINGIGSGEQAAGCLSYDVDAWLYYDHLNVDLCKQFPP